LAHQISKPAWDPESELRDCHRSGRPPKEEKAFSNPGAIYKAGSREPDFPCSEIRESNLQAMTVPTVFGLTPALTGMALAAR
jgi:hypothetical protein